MTKKLMWFALGVIVASLVGIAVHVCTLEWVLPWVARQMGDKPRLSSWQVRDLAIFTSIEYGIAVLVIYLLAREKLQPLGKLRTTLVFAVLLLMLNGEFIRQPLMDYAIGHLLSVVLLENGMKWLLWLLVSATIVYGCEWRLSQTSSACENSNNR